MRSGKITNWAGNVEFSAAEVHRPGSIAELQHLVANSPSVRALGTGHSFNEIADTPGTMVSVAALPARLEIDSETSTAVVGGGLRWADLGGALHQAGFALPNTGSLPHISVAGACSTGTHGSGNLVGNLATFVSGLEMVTAEGDLVSYSRASEPARFDGMVLSLGALGIITALTLDLIPTFHVRQDVYHGLTHESYLANFDEVMALGYSVSTFSTWRPPRQHEILVKSRTESHDTSAAAPTVHRSTLATENDHPTPQNMTQQFGVPGPWNERLPHFRLEFTPSSGQEIQSEYFVRRDQAVHALRELQDIAQDIASVLQAGEIRTTAADDLWLSPSYQRDSACLHFTWIRDEAAIAPVVAAIEERLAVFDARPHWGKRFTVAPAEISRLYPRLDEFRGQMRELDPTAKFQNDLIRRLLGG